MRLKEEIPMLLEEHPKPIKLPFTDMERLLAFLGAGFLAIGVAMLILSEKQTAAIIFGSIGLVIILYVLICQIPAFISLKNNKENLVIPIQKALEERGYRLGGFTILRMWEEGSIKRHGIQYFAGARQSKKFVIAIS